MCFEEAIKEERAGNKWEQAVNLRQKKPSEIRLGVESMARETRNRSECSDRKRLGSKCGTRSEARKRETREGENRTELKM